jgi:hypothetical protein
MTESVLFGGSGRENILGHYSEPCIPASQLKTKRLSNPSPKRLQPIAEQWPYVEGAWKEFAIEPKLLGNRINSTGSEYCYKVVSEFLMSKVTKRMTVKSISRNLGNNGALTTCPRKSRALLDRFWSVTEHAGCYLLWSQLYGIRKH